MLSVFSVLQSKYQRKMCVCVLQLIVCQEYFFFRVLEIGKQKKNHTHLLQK